MTDFKNLSLSRLRKMARAGQQILECYRLLGKTDANVVGEVLEGQGEFYEWDHYPPGDVFDHETNAQYYYHAHPPEGRAEKFGAEHGHFHTFLRPKGMPRNIRPAKVLDFEKPEGDNDALTHFVGIAMSPGGFPTRLFTTNRWVTGEVWYKASSVISLIDRFSMDLAYPSLPVNIWITGMLQLFRPDIEKLLMERDQAVQEWLDKHPGENVYEDRGLEITSIQDISVEKQIKLVNKALKAAKTG
ncbi:MAG: hypothetical protein O3A85_08110 [Proteobacteria bacterium]|nr:hypothetical protein [Pseudomonadota bacterium]